MRWVGSDGVEFGVGDTVECVEDDFGELLPDGFTDQVVLPAGDPAYVWLKTRSGGWWPHRFKLAGPARPTPTHVRTVPNSVRTTLPVDSAARKEVPIYSGPFRMFPAALAGLARVCRLGSAKHNPSEPIQHNRAKSKDHADCIARHMIDMSEDFGRGVGRDEKGVPQVDYIVWRACALAQEWHEVHDGAPVAPAATNVGGV